MCATVDSSTRISEIVSGNSLSVVQAADPCRFDSQPMKVGQVPPVTDPEAAVRAYLDFLADPESARDEAAIARAEAAVAKAEDPIESLRALAELDRARTVDGSAQREAFIRHARAWASTEQIPASAFLKLNVPAEDLAAAGITAAPRTTRGRGRAPRLDIDDVASQLPSGNFTLKDVAQRIDRETGTTRRYVQQLVDRGLVADLGEDPDHDGRGRAPHLYKKS